MKGYIGVDLGTSAVKLILMDENGSILGVVSKEYPISFPKQGWSEQNPYDWYDKSVEGIRELVAANSGIVIDGISFGGQMHYGGDGKHCICRLYRP
jgi:xylulokinase